MSEHSDAPGFVRPAKPSDLPAMGQVHAAAMLASLEAGHAGPLPEGVRAMISAPVIATGWEDAVCTPPSAQHHVLVATSGEALVGLAAIAPVTAQDSENPNLQAVEIAALGVTPAQQRNGHGSRLLAACADLARTDGANVMLAWAVRGDDSLSRLFVGAGMTPTTNQRTVPVGDGVTEVCWVAAL